MSGTTPTADPPVVPTPPVVPVTTTTTPDTLRSQAFIYACLILPLGAGVLFGVFKYLSAEVAAALAGSALTMVLGNPSQFFFGASKHQSTPPGTTTTTTTPGTQP